MHWSGMGLGGVAWGVRFREVEFFVRRLFHIARRDPEEELPESELSDGEQPAAIGREAARRLIGERG